MWMITLLMVVLLAHVTQGVTRYDTGKGFVYKLSVVQDVTLESPYRNYNYLPHLHVSRHPHYPNKRSLVKFENLHRYCPASKVVSAKMYLYYVYAHKASWHPSHHQNPFCSTLYSGSLGEKILERASSYQLQAFIIYLLVDTIPWFG